MDKKKIIIIAASVFGIWAIWQIMKPGQQAQALPVTNAPAQQPSVNTAPAVATTTVPSATLPAASVVSVAPSATPWHAQLSF